MLRDWLGDWLRRLANRINPAPSAAAGAAARVGFDMTYSFTSVDVDEMRRHWAKRGPGTAGS